MSDSGKLFVLRWEKSSGDAKELVHCARCGAERYTSAENLQAAISNNLEPTCQTCLVRLIGDEEMMYGGTVRNGKVIEGDDD